MRPENGERAVRGWIGCILAVGLLAGCDQPAPSDEGRAQVLEAVAVARSADSVEFSQITDVDVDSRGQIYAGDALGELVVLDGGGRLVRRFGRMGAGPGEFESIGTIRLLAGDSLYVYDGVGLRATVYTPHSNRVAYTVRMSQPDLSFPMTVEPIGGEELIAHFRRINGEVPIAGQQRNDVIRILNRDGSIRRDSVVVVPEPDVLEVRSGQATGFFHPPFARSSLVRWGPDGRIYSLWTDSAHVTIHDTNGRSRGGFVADLPASRAPVADATIDSIAARNTGSGITPGTLRDALRARWRTWPLVEDMLVDDRSRVWLRPVTHAPLADWLAFDARGTQVARFRLPRTVHPRLIRGDRLYAVSRDSLDVESLAVYRLTPRSTPPPERP